MNTPNYELPAIRILLSWSRCGSLDGKSFVCDNFEDVVFLKHNTTMDLRLNKRLCLEWPGEFIVKQVKGTMMKRTAIPIKANKTGAYDKLLSDRAKNLLAERILDPVWYPLELQRECFDALCQVEANNDPRIIIQWGRKIADDLLQSVYRASITAGGIKSALYSFVRMHRMIYNFGTVEGKILSDHEAELIYKDFEPDWKNIFYMVIGWVQRFFEFSLGKPVRYQLVKDPMDESIHIKLSWS